MIKVYANFKKFISDNNILDIRRNKQLLKAKDIFKKIEIISKYEALKEMASPKTYDYFKSIIVMR